MIKEDNIMMTNREFIEILKKMLQSKTLYVNGGWGWPLYDANKSRALRTNNYNKQKHRQDLIMAATPDTFGFDCVCMIKAALWGWNGNAAHRNGGASYVANGVPDLNADQMIRACGPRYDWTEIVPGAVVWMPGHIGVYIGDRQVIECSPAWEDGVQVSYLNFQKTANSGEHWRDWRCWGLLPWVSYSEDLDMLTYEQFKDYMNRYLDEVKTAPADMYARAALEWVRCMDIMVGDGNGNLMPHAPVTRQDLAVVLKRYDKQTR